MAFSKANQFLPHEYHFSLMCQVLGHPARIRILRKIVEGGENGATFSQIATAIPIARTTFSQHFSYLRNMNIISSINHGDTTQHFLNPNLNFTYFRLVQLLISAPNQLDEEDIKDLQLIRK